MKRNKRLLTFGIPLVVILFAAVFYQYVYLGVRSEIASIREQQDARMKTLGRYVDLIAQKPELEKQLAAAREQSKAQSVKLIEGEPISLASANLQDMAKGIVTGRGGTISSERIGKVEDLVKNTAPPAGSAAAAAASKTPAAKKNTKPSEGPKLQVLSVSLDATLPETSALNDILYSIETRTPYLVLKELDVRVRNFREPRELMVRMDVTGLYGGK